MTHNQDIRRNAVRISENSGQSWIPCDRLSEFIKVTIRFVLSEKLPVTRTTNVEYLPSSGTQGRQRGERVTQEGTHRILKVSAGALAL